VNTLEHTKKLKFRKTIGKRQGNKACKTSKLHHKTHAVILKIAGMPSGSGKSERCMYQQTDKASKTCQQTHAIILKILVTPSESDKEPLS